MKILIADDDLITRTLLRGLLVKWGYDVCEVDNGEEAWQHFQEADAAQLAVLDWMMPRMTGIELCRRLRESKRRSPLYLVLLTSNSSPNAVMEGLNAGADDFVRKPFDPGELQARLRVGFRLVVAENEHLQTIQELSASRQALAGQLEWDSLMVTISSLFLQTGTRELPETFRRALRDVGSLLAVDKVSLCYCHFRRQHFHWLSPGCSGQNEPQCQEKERFLRAWLNQHLEGEPFICDQVAGYPGMPEEVRCFLQGNNVLSCLYLPLNIAGEMIGCLQLETRINERSWSEEDIRRGFMLVNLFINVYEQQRKDRLLEELSTTDELTRVWNRRKGEQLLEQEMGRAERYHLQLSMAIVDLDHFKRVNDEHGHDVGDQVLIAFAATLQDCLRDSDAVVRWGGEEFMVLLPNTDQKGAVVFCERMRQATEEMRIAGGPSVTASFGVTVFRRDESLAAFFKRADTNLYQAKELGRNRVVAD